MKAPLWLGTCIISGCWLQLWLLDIVKSLSKSMVSYKYDFLYTKKKTLAILAGSRRKHNCQSNSSEQITKVTVVSTD
jgi:hypothetical protein